MHEATLTTRVFRARKQVARRLNVAEEATAGDAPAPGRGPTGTSMAEASAPRAVGGKGKLPAESSQVVIFDD